MPTHTLGVCKHKKWKLEENDVLDCFSPEDFTLFLAFSR